MTEAQITAISILSYKIIIIYLNSTIFLWHTEKPRHWPVLWLGGLALVEGSQLLMLPLFNDMDAYHLLIFGGVFLFTAIIIHIMFRQDLGSSLFCAIAGYTIQHMATKVRGLVRLFITLPRGYFWDFGILLLTCLVIDWVLYQTFIKTELKNQGLKIRQPLLLTMMLAVFLVLISDHWLSGRGDTVARLVSHCSDLLFCLMMLLLLESAVSRQATEKRLEITHQMLVEQQKQYELSRASIEQVNIKCHDMRHQLRALRKQGSIDPQALMELEKSITIYDSMAKTGSKALDTILAEKTLHCGKYGVQISSIADGKQLAFMEDAEIYALFGNLLDNAIRSVTRLEPDKRDIGLIVRVEGEMLSIQSTNYYEGDVVMENGLPKTTQADPEHHGFGTRSMQLIVQKYGGHIHFDFEEGIFSLYILIPLPRK